MCIFNASFVSLSTSYYLVPSSYNDNEERGQLRYLYMKSGTDCLLITHAFQSCTTAFYQIVHSTSPGCCGIFFNIHPGAGWASEVSKEVWCNIYVLLLLVHINV